MCEASMLADGLLLLYGSLAGVGVAAILVRHRNKKPEKMEELK
jgi:hypothetical protein